MKILNCFTNEILFEIARKNLQYLEGAYLEGANLEYANLDFSSLYFGCASLNAQFDNKQIIQILFHAAMPCENNKNITDPDLKKLLKTKIFQKVVNKFHRTEIDRFDSKKVL